MSVRYSLRIESGDRRGETIPIGPAGLTVGRRPGNALVLQDNSVSGKHAEIVIEREGVLVRDLGSTNGTRVGSERVLEQRIEDGDTLTFGNVRCTFRDGEAQGPLLEEEELEIEPQRRAPLPASAPPESAGLSGTRVVPAPPSAAGAASAAAAPAGGGDGLVRVRADLIARAARSSPAAAIGLAAAALVAIGVGAWLWLGSGSSSGPALRAVEPVAGNLLGNGYSFEGDRDPWTALEGAPAAFLRNGSARRSGAEGVRADLAPGEWAQHLSAAFPVAAEREVTARAYLRARGAARGRLGVEFRAAEGSEAPPDPITAWARPVEAGSEHVECAITAQVPPGYAQARVVILARAPGSGADPAGGGEGGAVDADDVSAVLAPAPARPAATLGNAALFLHGDPPNVAQLVRGDRVLISSLGFAAAGAPAGEGGVPLAARVDGPRIVVEAEGRPAQLVLRAEEPLVAGGVATTGPSGYRTHGVTNERDDVEGILLGRGLDLVRAQLVAPSRVRGARSGQGGTIVVELGAADPRVALQLDFSADKGAAEDLAHAARGAERKGELGHALARWRDLLDRYPYEQALVDEAETRRAELVKQGLDQVRAVRADLENARFFALPAMLRATRERALTIGQRFAGSEVEREAAALAEELSREIDALDVDTGRAERARLAAVLAALEARKATGLADVVRARLAALGGS